MTEAAFTNRMKGCGNVPITIVATTATASTVRDSDVSGIARARPRFECPLRFGRAFGTVRQARSSDEIEHVQLPDVKRRLDAAQAAVGKETSGESNVVGEEDVALVLGDWTGIPVSRMLEAESDKLAAAVIQAILKPTAGAAAAGGRS